MRDEHSDDVRDGGVSETDFDFCLSIAISEVWQRAQLIHFPSLFCPADFLYKAPESSPPPLSSQDLNSGLISTVLSKALEGQTCLQCYPAPNWQRISDLEKLFRSLKNCWDNNPLGLEGPVLQLLIHTFWHVALWLVSQEGSITFTLWTWVWPFDLSCSRMSVDHPGLESCVLGLVTEAETNKDSLMSWE